MTHRRLAFHLERAAAIAVTSAATLLALYAVAYHLWS